LGLRLGLGLYRPTPCGMQRCNDYLRVSSIVCAEVCVCVGFGVGVRVRVKRILPWRGWDVVRDVTGMFFLKVCL